jgi:hypothetical protein
MITRVDPFGPATSTRTHRLAARSVLLEDVPVLLGGIFRTVDRPGQLYVLPSLFPRHNCPP